MTSEGIESTRMLELQAWLEVNKKRVAVVAAVVAVVVGALAIHGYVKREGERAASSALLELQGSESPASAGVVSASAFQQLAVDHAGTAAAARARLLAAEVLFQGGHYAEARAEFERAAGLLKDDALRAVAVFGRAACLDALGQTEEAMQAYEQVTLRHSTSSVAGQARLAMAGIHERRGELEQAMGVLRELSDRLDSSWAGTARQRQESLLLRHPELAPAEEENPMEEGTVPEAVVTETNAPN